MNLDSRTIMIITACMGPLMAMVLLAMRSNYPTAIRGLGWWAQGACWAFVGVLLITGRGTLPPFWSVVVGNGLMMLGMVQWLLGTRRFLGVPTHTSRWMQVLVFSLVLLAWYLMVQPSYEARSLIVSATMCLFLLACARPLMRQSKYRFASRFLVLALLGNASTWVARTIGHFGGYMNGQLFADNTFNTLLNASQTAATLLTLIGFVLLASERVREEFEKLASRDSLTGILTRRAWNSVAQTEMERSQRHGRSLSLATMDLDYFKRINDSHGHLAGDQALLDFARLVGRHLRRHDQFGRMGGEEFVLLLPETSLQEAASVAERIRLSVQNAQSVAPFTVSMGLTTLVPEDLSVDMLLARADAALYRAKAKGRNRVELDAGLANLAQFPGGLAPGSTTAPSPLQDAATDSAPAPLVRPVKSALRHVSPRRG
ncbi:GGDEF domain-containing protein [Rhodoferax saidenbachensis]|uniref:diguanylate cyclase n=1 Tax=Rhodoferax saidenbachensis TaxID=1484693 RepID=A0A1P8K9M3_9BURK|nr:GGDEF domain-containing protein [Rhodoferax saidenbachensis]